MESPHTSHFQAALSTLKYISGDPSLGLFMSPGLFYRSCPFATLIRHLVLILADWWAEFFSVWKRAHLLKSKKQAVVSLSFAEAEYRSMRRLMAEITWLVRFLHDIGAFPSFTSSSPLRQTIGDSYCKEPSFSRTDQAHRAWLSLCSWKTAWRLNFSVFYSIFVSTRGFVHESSCGSITSVSSLQIGSPSSCLPLEGGVLLEIISFLMVQ